MSNISMATKHDVEIKTLYLDGSSLRTVNLDITVAVGPEVDVSWTNSATVTLFYGLTLIGVMTLEKLFIYPEDHPKGSLYIELNESDIQNMSAFKSFIRDIMPKTEGVYQSDEAKHTAQLEIVEEGHKLAIAVDLHSLGSYKTTAPIVQLSGDSLEITFSLSNTTTVAIYFGEAEFKLEKDGDDLAKLSGDFCIYPEDDHEYYLTGKISPGCRLSGKAILKGASLESKEQTWRIHAIREFQIEVDLDHMVIRNHQ